MEQRFADHLFSEWLEEPVALGCIAGETLAGVIEGSMEACHDIFRIKQGFRLNRIDLCEYSNEDVQRKEVRLDFFLPFQSAEKEG